MLFNLERQQRNYNYLKLIKAYNLLLTDCHSKKSISKKDFYSFLEEIKGLDTADEIYDALLPDDYDEDDQKKLELFYKSGTDEYKLTKDNKIMPVASKEEALVIYSMLINGDFDLYIDDKDRILQNLEDFFSDVGIKPFDYGDYITIRGKSNITDSIAKIKSRYKTIESAIHNGKFIKFDYYKNNPFDENICVYPESVICSQLDERFRVKAYCYDGKLRTFYLSLIENLSVTDEKPFEIREPSEKYNTLVFSFKNEKGLPERVCARFSDYKKQIKYNKKKNELTYSVEYIGNPLESARIINRLLSLGSNLDIKSDERLIVQERAKKALALYK
ncbi:MAG: WYL domain-containing protein [Eubacterium sp.]|nr:WYL domain-containing protein [Eubacterium sp.]